MLSQKEISPIVLNRKFNKYRQPVKASALGAVDVLTILLPQLCSDSLRQNKNKRRLSQMDPFIQQETETLVKRINHLCSQLKINQDTTFRVALHLDDLKIIGRFEGQSKLVNALNNDHWLVDTFKWLQSYFKAAAHSLEITDFSNDYQFSPAEATKKYTHCFTSSYGQRFSIGHDQEQLYAQVESPLNLYQVTICDK